MSTGQRYSVSTDSVNIATDLSGKEGYLVNRGAGNTVAIAANATKPLYVLLEGLDGSTTADSGTIAMVGAQGSIALVKIGGTVTAGDKITANASGLGITTTTAGNYYVGVATQSGVANDVIPVDIAQNGMVASA